MKRIIAIALSLLLLMGLLSGCSKEVTVDAAGLEHMTLEGAAVAMTKEGYTAKLVPQAHYVLPETITVTMEDQGEQSYSYDPATGQLTFPKVTGNITIAGTAVESIVGTWRGTVDFTQAISEALGADPSAAEYFSFENLTLDLIMTFDAQGNCTLAIDEASAKATMDTIAQVMLDGTLKLLDDLLSIQDPNFSVEDYLAASGTTMEDLKEQISAELKMEDLVGELSQEGTYEIRDGKLYIADGDEAFTEDDASAYTLQNGVLTIEAPADADQDESAAIMFPLVLNRAD